MVSWLTTSWEHSCLPEGQNILRAPFCLVPFTFFQTVFMHNKYRASLWGIKVYQACFMFCHISKELWAQAAAQYISDVTSLIERWSLLWIYDLLGPAWSKFPPPSVNTDVAFCPGFSLLVIFVEREILKKVFKSNITFVTSFKLVMLMQSRFYTPRINKLLLIEDFLFLYLESCKTFLIAKLTDTGSLYFSHVYTCRLSQQVFV